MHKHRRTAPRVGAPQAIVALFGALSRPRNCSHIAVKFSGGVRPWWQRVDSASLNHAHVRWLVEAEFAARFMPDWGDWSTRRNLKHG